MAYVSISEFKSAPTGIDTMSLIPGGTQAQNDAELTNVLERASEWANTITSQETLTATRDTDTREVRFGYRDGSIMVVPDALPIVSVESMKWRIAGSDVWADVPLNNVMVYQNYFVLLQNPSLMIGPNMYTTHPWHRTALEFAHQSRIPVMLQYTYVNGYSHTEISGSPTAGATLFSVADPVGINVGQRLTVYDGANTETVNVASVLGSTIGISGTLKYTHASGTPISALPASVKQATILLASYLIKERGSLSVSMNETSLQGIGRYKDAADLDIARELLAPFRKVL